MRTKLILIISSIVVLGGLGIWWYVKGSDKHLQLIPGNAAFVAMVDFRSLGHKVEMDKVKELNWYKQMTADMADSRSDETKAMKEALDNPFNMGVNFLSDFYLFSHTTDDITYTGLAFDVRNADDLEKTIKKFDEKEEIFNEDGIRLIEFGSGYCAWNDQGGVIVSDTDYDEESEIRLKAYVKGLFTQGKSASMAANDHFHSLMKKKKDINFFVNGAGYAAFLEKAAGRRALDFLGNSNIIKEMYSITTLDFQDDAIVFESSYESDNPDYEKMMDIGGSGISNEMQQLATAQKVYAVAALSFNQQKLMEFLKSIPATQRAINEITTQLQLTEAELTELVSGEIMASMNDVRISKVPELPALSEDEIAALPFDQMLEYQMQAYRQPEPYAIFSVSIRSNVKNKWKELLANIGPRMNVMNIGEGLYVLPAGRNLPNAYIVETPIGFTLTNDSIWVNQCKSGGTAASAQAVQPYLTGSAMSGYMNMNMSAYPQEFQTFMTAENTITSGVLSYLSLFNEVRFTGQSSSGKISIALQQGEGNSLYQLIAQVDVVKNEMDRLEAERERELPPMDDIVVAPQETEPMPAD